jgi:DNA-binding response OmpR family regulator
MRPTLLFVESDPYVVRMVTRHLTAYEVVAVANPAELAQQVERYRPFAILYNLRPDRERPASLKTAVSIPIIECSLPSHSWMASTMGVVAMMTKPIDFEQLHAEINQAGDVVNILAIDDNPGMCQLIERSLGAGNGRYTIRIAYDGNAGLRAMGQQRPDFVILDLMPEMEGFEVIQQMKADPALATVPILLLTATTYIEETLVQYGNQVKIVQSDPWHPAKTLRFLEAALSILNPKTDPDYD